MKAGDIVIRDRSRTTEIKFRITSMKQLSDANIPVFRGYRVKFDKRNKEWISFGEERIILNRHYRIFNDDDYHYL